MIIAFTLFRNILITVLLYCIKMQEAYETLITSVRREIERLKWKVRYVPHEIIENYNACYRVVYKGEIIYPPAADKLKIPLNEIWISERLKEYEEYVLFHELKEILYRYQGYDVIEAHIRARIDEALRFCNDTKWVKYYREFPDSIVPLECLKIICKTLKTNDLKNIKNLYRKIMKCVNTSV